MLQSAIEEQIILFAWRRTGRLPSLPPITCQNRTQSTGHIGGPPPAPIGCRKRRKPRASDMTSFDGGSSGGFGHDFGKRRYGGGSSLASSDHVRESQRRCSRRDARACARKISEMRSQSGQEPRRTDHGDGQRPPGRDSGTAPSCIGNLYHNHQQPLEEHRPAGTSSVRGWPVDSVECQSADKGHSTPTSSACVRTANDEVGGYCHQSEITSEAGGQDDLKRVRSSYVSEPDPLHTGRVGSSSRIGKASTTMLASAEKIAVVTRILGGESADWSRFASDVPYVIPSITPSASVEKDHNKNRPSLIRVSSPLCSFQLTSFFVKSHGVLLVDYVKKGCAG